NTRLRRGQRQPPSFHHNVRFKKLIKRSIRESEMRLLRGLLISMLIAAGWFLAGCRGVVMGGASSEELKHVNHVIILMQENRSFDHYFGKLGAYQVKQGLSAQIDGLPLDDKDNINFSNIGGDGSTIPIFHMSSVCEENLSSSWNETRADIN